ncbi:MAG: N-acetyltransferase [Phenylobacterium sp.]|uniref:GNAT family N-acetyltransferase n=1 Tax=Phenylobacterium sp. TaxID=1871053 RepID=UPI0027326105|nr:N-acetyltransferase [Phenylobacterium sp.]MDP1641021.1 N-acetyltransferase [Phenylobacterium sp.]MDP3117318.1 N-acetyltransferase [Phenylobacterium sp.]
MTAAVASCADSVASPAPDIRPETPQDAGAIEALLDHAFGPGRFAKASERVREVAPLRLDLSFCIWEGERLVGVVRQSEIAVGGRRLIFLGPLAVDAAARRLGAGARLVEVASAAAEAAGYGEVLLVGDPPFFGRLGFSAEATGQIVMPGPVDPRRLLLKRLGQSGGTNILQGAVTAP